MGRHSAPTKRELRAAARAAERTNAAAIDAAQPQVARGLQRAATEPRIAPESRPEQLRIAESATTTSTRRALGSVGVRRLAAVGAGVLVLGTTVGFVSLGKHVDVVVDGQHTSVTTYASDVSGALIDAGVRPSAADSITPSLDSSVTDGAVISLVRSRVVSVVIDGKPTAMRVTAYTAQEAVDQLGLNDHAFVSSRSQRLPLTGAQIRLASYDDVTIAHDGVQEVVKTPAQTVRQALQDAEVTLSDTDEVTPSLDTALSAGMTIQVTRVAEHTETAPRAIAHQSVTQDNPNEYVGINSVLTAGVDGVEDVTYLVREVDGQQTTRTETGSTVTTAPVNEVVATGSKQFPANVNALNWQALGYCESTNNPKAVNKTNGKYFGEYQFSFATWASVGGTGNPADAPAEEQLARAKILYMKAGAGQWECGSHLYD